MNRACVIGWPIEHSRSPLIHGHWLARHGLQGVYEKRGVPPEEIESFLADLQRHGYVGANVTVPYKEVALRTAAHADEAATSVGAANTLWFENGVLCASNTDVYGFLCNLDDQAPGWDDNGRLAVVLGAGGAARSVLRGLIERDFDEIRVVNRSSDRAEQLARFFGPRVRALDWEQRSGVLEGADILINTTTLGMNGTALEIDLRGLPEGALVTDVIYVPLDTALLRQARRRDLRIADGLGMLLHQAVPGFEKWFGIRPEVTPELRELVLRSIAAGHTRAPMD